MKYTVALLLVLATANVQAWNVPDFGKGPLHDDLKEFLQLFPLEQVQTILKEYKAQDAEFQAFARLLKAEFKGLVKDIETIPEVINSFNYFQKNGIDVYKYINIMNERLGLDKLQPPNTFNDYVITGGLAGLIHDFKAVFPVTAYVRLYTRKMATSAAFRDFMNYIRTPEFQSIGPKVYASPHFQTLLLSIKKAGIDLVAAKKILNLIFGIPATFSVFGEQKSLADELHDFAELVPVNKIVPIIRQYIETDAEVQAVLRFAQSTEFHNLVYEVEALPEYQQLVLYLQSAGFDPVEYIQTIHTTLGMKKYVPPVAHDFDEFETFSLYANRGIAGLISDIKAVLPLEQIKNLYNRKLKESKVFADFIAKLSSPDMQKIVDSLYRNPTYLKMVNKAKAAGLDLAALRNLLTTMLGLHFPKTF